MRAPSRMGSRASRCLRMTRSDTGSPMYGVPRTDGVGRIHLSGLIAGEDHRHELCSGRWRHARPSRPQSPPLSRLRPPPDRRPRRPHRWPPGQREWPSRGRHRERADVCRLLRRSQRERSRVRGGEPPGGRGRALPVLPGVAPGVQSAADASVAPVTPAGGLDLPLVRAQTRTPPSIERWRNRDGVNPPAGRGGHP